MEINYGFKYYSESKNDIKNAEKEILDIFVNEGIGWAEEEYLDTKEISHLRYEMDFNDVSNIAKKNNVCIGVNITNDDDPFGWMAFIFNNTGENVDRVNGFDMLSELDYDEQDEADIYKQCVEGYFLKLKSFYIK